MTEKFEIYQIGKSFYSNKNEAIKLANESFLGELKSGKVIYNIYEVLYLLEKKYAQLLKGKKPLNFEKLINSLNHNNYLVFRDLRNKGHIVKEGLKFGSDFRVYEKGKKPGKDHASYLLLIVDSNKKMDLKDFAAKSRIANTTNKKLLLAIIDSEEDFNYYEVGWKNIK